MKYMRFYLIVFELLLTLRSVIAVILEALHGLAAFKPTRILK